MVNTTMQPKLQRFTGEGRCWHLSVSATRLRRYSFAVSRDARRSIPTTRPHRSRPYAAFLDETLAIATVSRDLVYDCAILDEQQAFKAFTKLACFAVAHEYGVTGLEWYSTLVPDGGLNFTRPFERNEPGAVWQVGLRLLFGAY